MQIVLPFLQIGRSLGTTQNSLICLQFLTTLLTFLIPAQALGQEGFGGAFFNDLEPVEESDEEIQQLTPSQREEVARILGIPVGGRHMVRILENYYSGAAMNAEPVGSPGEDEQAAVIFRHLRGTEGQPLPAPEAQPKLFSFGAKEQAQVVAEQQAFNDQIGSHFAESITYPDCRDGKTEKMMLVQEEAIEPKMKETPFDMLFIAKKRMQMNLDEVFGEDVRIVPVSDEPGDFGAMSARGFNVECLPFRIRVTGAATFRHQGEDAVRDYREDVLGKGVLTERSRTLLGRGTP